MLLMSISCSIQLLMRQIGFWIWDLSLRLEKIVEQMDMPPCGRSQTILFSAHFSKRNTVLAVGRVGSSTDLIVLVTMARESFLVDLLRAPIEESEVVMFQDGLFPSDWKWGNRGVLEVFSGFPATSIHGDITQQGVDGVHQQGLATFQELEHRGFSFHQSPGLEFVCRIMVMR